jgi:hypothetical protein
MSVTLWTAVARLEVGTTSVSNRPILLEVVIDTAPPMWGAGLSRLGRDQSAAVLAMSREQAEELIAQLQAALAPKRGAG